MWKLAAKLLVSAVLVWLVVGGLDLGALGAQLASVRPGAVVGAVALLLALGAVQAWRWGRVVRAGGDRLGYAALLKSVLIALFFNQTLPSSIGGDAVRMWRAYRAGVPAGRAVSGVVLDRVAALAALSLLALAASPLLFERLAEPAARWGVLAVAAAALAGTALLLGLDRLGGPVRRLPGAQWLRRLPGSGRLAGPARHLAGLARHGRAVLLGRTAAPVFLASLAIHAGVAFAVFLLARGLGLAVTMLDCLILVPPVILVTTLPISIAGWGVREGAMVVAFGMVGVAAVDAVALSVLFGLAVMLSGVPGGILWVATGRRPVRPVREMPAARPAE